MKSNTKITKSLLTIEKPIFSDHKISNTKSTKSLLKIETIANCTFSDHIKKSNSTK